MSAVARTSINPTTSISRTPALSLAKTDAPKVKTDGFDGRGGTFTPASAPNVDVDPKLAAAGDQSVKQARLQGPAAVDGAGAANAPTHSEAEIRSMFEKKIMPGVNKGLEAMGANSNESRCDTASAMTKHALDKLGVKPSRIVEGDGHVFVEVKTKGEPSKTLILDPTMGQFVRDGTKLDQKVREKGFVGTKSELADTIHDNKNDFQFSSASQLGGVRKKFSEGVMGKAYDAIQNGGPLPDGVSRSDLKVLAPDVRAYRQELVGQHHYPKEVTPRFSKNAKSTLSWWQNGGTGSKMARTVAGQPPVDRADAYRTGFQALEGSLGVD